MFCYPQLFNSLSPVDSVVMYGKDYILSSLLYMGAGRGQGGTRIYVDTSQRVQYASTRAFYESLGYRLETVLKDFYDQGDGKAIYCKSLI